MTALRPPVVSRAEPEIVDRVDAAGVADMTEVARLAAARYGIPPDCRLHLYPLTENWTFRIEADGAVTGRAAHLPPGQPLARGDPLRAGLDGGAAAGVADRCCPR